MGRSEIACGDTDLPGAPGPLPAAPSSGKALDSAPRRIALPQLGINGFRAGGMILPSSVLQMELQATAEAGDFHLLPSGGRWERVPPQEGSAAIPRPPCRPERCQLPAIPAAIQGERGMLSPACAAGLEVFPPCQALWDFPPSTRWVPSFGWGLLGFLGEAPAAPAAPQHEVSGSCHGGTPQP